MKRIVEGLKIAAFILICGCSFVDSAYGQDSQDSVGQHIRDNCRLCQEISLWKESLGQSSNDSVRRKIPEQSLIFPAFIFLWNKFGSSNDYPMQSLESVDTYAYRFEERDLDYETSYFLLMMLLDCKKYDEATLTNEDRILFNVIYQELFAVIPFYETGMVTVHGEYEKMDLSSLKLSIDREGD